MSQSRSRKPQSFGGEHGTRPRAAVVKESGDAAHSVHHKNQPKNNQNSRNKNKIPKSIRYDLDNALVSLCDVWFEDIKPHLVRNNIKLHVDSKGATTASGDYNRLPASTIEPGCSHLDPGAASDRRRLTRASSAACYSTPQTASRVQSHRQPRAPPPPRTQHLGATAQNKKKKIKSPKGSCYTVQPQSPPSATRRPRVCQSCQPSELKSRNMARTVHTAPTYSANNNLSAVTRRKITRLSKKTQTSISWVRNQFIYEAHKEPVAFKAFPMNTNVGLSCTRKPQQQPRPGSMKSYVISETPKPVKRHSAESKKLVNTTDAVSPKNSRPATQKWTKQESAQKMIPAFDRHRSPEKKITTNSVLDKRTCKPQMGDIKLDTTIAPRSPGDTEEKPNSQFWRCFATTNLNQAKSKKECVKNNKHTNIDTNVIFDEELIDIIGAKNDKRLRVLYKSPVREEMQSVLNLLPSPTQRKVEARRKRKTQPWR